MSWLVYPERFLARLPMNSCQLSFDFELWRGSADGEIIDFHALYQQRKVIYPKYTLSVLFVLHCC